MWYLSNTLINQENYFSCHYSYKVLYLFFITLKVAAIQEWGKKSIVDARLIHYICPQTVIDQLLWNVYNSHLEFKMK